MKIKKLDAHDRFDFFTGQSFDIDKTVKDMVDRRPFGDHPFYIFGHKREIALDERIGLYNDDLRHSVLYSVPRKYANVSDVPSARLIWQPRLTKPEAQPNSMLFKAYPGTENIKIIWILPQRELWEQYQKGKMTENETVSESIYNFLHNKEKMEHPEDDDLSDKEIDMIYKELSHSSKEPKFFSI